MIMRVKNHHTPPTMRPDKDLEREEGVGHKRGKIVGTVWKS